MVRFKAFQSAKATKKATKKVTEKVTDIEKRLLDYIMVL